ncbi:MAG: hypothetical protein ACLFR1_15670 [Spirochaetia bacterium]
MKNVKLRYPPVFRKLKGSKYNIQLYDPVVEIKTELLNMPELEESVYQFLVKKQKQVLEYFSQIPEDYEELLEEIIAAASRENESKTAKEPEGFQLVTQALALRKEFRGTIQKLITSYISHRKEADRRMLLHYIPLVLLYEDEHYKKDTSLLSRVKSNTPHHYQLISDLHIIFVQRMNILKYNVLNDMYYSFVKRLRNRAQKVIPDPLQKMQFVSMVPQESLKTDFSEIYQKLTGYLTCIAPVWDPEPLQKIQSMVENFKEKYEQIQVIFTQWFDTAKVQSLFAAFTKSCVKKQIQKTNVFQTTDYYLYPCKDHLDAVKGIFSHDCTTSQDLAKDHLACTEYFTIRIFRQKNWIGNIYVLDYSESHNILIIDRIQLHKKYIDEDTITVRDFMKAVLEFLTDDYSFAERLSVLAPSKISNHSLISETYQSFVSRKKKIELPSSLVIPDVFESSDYWEFIVLK